MIILVCRHDDHLPRLPSQPPQSRGPQSPSEDKLRLVQLEPSDKQVRSALEIRNCFLFYPFTREPPYTATTTTIMLTPDPPPNTQQQEVIKEEQRVVMAW